MLKKTLIITGAAVVVPALIFGTDAWSYMRTATQSVRASVKSEVPPEFEVKRIKELVDNLVPEIRKCMHVIAEQQVDIEYLDQDIARREGELAQQQKTLLSMTDQLDSGVKTFYISNRTYSAEEISQDLTLRFGKFKVAKEGVDRDKKILKAREKALKANQQTLENMLSQKQELEVKIAQLDARLKSIQAAETVSELAFDDSQLSQAKQAIRDLNKQLDVKERMLDVEGRFVNLIPMEDLQTAPQDITQQVRAYLQEQPEPADALVSTTVE